MTSTVSLKPSQTTLLLVVLLTMVASGCDSRNAKDDFNRQMEACSLGERNGLVDAASEACGNALAIADEFEYPAATVSRLLLRLGRLERQKGNFREAETLTRRSLAFPYASGAPEMRAAALIELSLDLAGQDRWQDGASLLREATPLLDMLTGDDRKLAAHTYRAYGAHLGKIGLVADAEHFTSVAAQLAEL